MREANIWLDERPILYNHMVVDELSQTFSALSDPTRRAILVRLAQGPATVNELAVPFQMTQQAVSKHLAYLEKASLIEKKKAGRQQICVLRPDAFDPMKDWILACQSFWAESFARLAELVEKEKGYGE